MPANVWAPTKRRALGVSITRTACPAPISCRTVCAVLNAAMPPVTPIRIRAMPLPPRRGLRASAVVVLEFALRDLLQGDRQVVLGACLDHRRRELVERALAEVVVVRVDLTGALGGHEDARVVRVDVFEQLVDTR